MKLIAADAPDGPLPASPPVASRPQPVRAKRVIELHRPLLSLFSIIVAARIVSGVIHRLPEKLSARTDIIGYPTATDFNVNRYFQTFDLIIVLLPLVACGLYFGLR